MAGLKPTKALISSRAKAGGLYGLSGKTREGFSLGGRIGFGEPMIDRLIGHTEAWKEPYPTLAQQPPKRKLAFETA